MNEQILVIEDAPEFQQLLREMLTRENYRVAVADTGERGLEMARSLEPQVILLDLMLPDSDGVELCKTLRSFTDAYIVMVTGRDEEVDKLVGLAIGADDYITKPFSGRELVARIRAMLRRPRAFAEARESIRDFGHLIVDVAAREVHVDGELCNLTKIEFDILDALSGDAKRVHSRASLLEAVWGENWVGDHHVVDVHLANLRKKIDTNGRRNVATVRGVGYRFIGGTKAAPEPQAA